jgi:hypothetical protein
MTNEEKQEKLKKRREAYHQRKKTKESALMTNEEKQEKLKKRREAYQRKKKTKESAQTQKSVKGNKKYANLHPQQKTKRCAHNRLKYADMQPEQKKAIIEQITANQELKRSKQPKDSIAMENPAYIETELEVRASTFNVEHREHVTPGERQTMLQRRNEEFTARKMKNVSVTSPQEDTSMMINGNNDREHLKQQGNFLNFI